jgi:glycosyltransferase involved in cell wall biosynthesis
MQVLLKYNERKFLKILLFGSLPPRIGGVSKSVETLMKALTAKKIDNSIILDFTTLKPLFRKYDIVHVHYAKRWKQILGLVLGKIVGKKTIMTLHGEAFHGEEVNSKFTIYTHIAAKLADGIIFLNKTAEERYKKLFPTYCILDSVFLEGISVEDIPNKNYIQRKDEKTYLLVYAFDKVIRKSKDVYGVDFILENINKFDDKYMIILVDISKGYQEDVKKVKNDSLIYLDHEVDFMSLLLEVDIYIRPTTTDGNSVALQEALLMEKKVLASDVIPRPEGTVTFKSENFDDFNYKLENLEKNTGKFAPNSVDEYVKFCHKVLA